MPTKQQPEFDDILDTFDASRFLKISERTLRQLAAEQAIPSVRVGNQFRFSKRQLLAHVEGRPLEKRVIRRAQEQFAGQIFAKKPTP